MYANKQPTKSAQFWSANKMGETQTLELHDVTTGECVWFETNAPRYVCRMMAELRGGRWEVTSPQPSQKRQPEFTHIVH